MEKQSVRRCIKCTRKLTNEKIPLCSHCRQQITDVATGVAGVAVVALKTAPKIMKRISKL